MLWIKKLLRRRWYVSYDCEECTNHFCGSCGRGVQEGNLYWTKKGAIKAGEDWLRQNLSDSAYQQRIVHTELDVHLTIVMLYVDENSVERQYSFFASVDPRS